MLRCAEAAEDDSLANGGVVPISRREANSGESGSAVLAMAHGGLSEGIQNLLATQFASVVLVADQRSLSACVAALHPDLLVLDVALTAGGSLDLARRLKEEFPGVRTLLLVDDDDPTVATAAAAAGVDGCLLKRSLGRDLLSAVDEVLGGRRVFWSSGGGAGRCATDSRRAPRDDER